MKAIITPQQAIKQIPILATEPSLSITPLTGGHSNRSYLIRTANQKYSLRLDGEAQQIFQNSRSFEFEILEKLSVYNLSPESIYAESNAGILCYRFIEGVKLKTEQLILSDIKKQFIALRQITTTLGNNYQTKPQQPLPGEIELSDDLPQIKRLKYLQAPLSPIIKQLKQFSSEHCLCHNDLSPDNLLLTKNHRLIALDWEYVAYNHPLLDFAFFANSWRLDDELLKLHFAESIHHPEINFSAVRQLAWFIEAVWYAKRQHFNPHKNWNLCLNEALQNLNSL